MKTRNMILSGVIALFLVAAFTQVAYAVTIGVPENPNAPQVFLIKKEFDICDMTGFSGGGGYPDGWFDGGSVPPSFITGEGDEQAGCVDWMGERYNEYLFTGEQLGVLVVARDRNGGLDLPSEALLLVDGVTRVKCNELELSQLESATEGTCKQMSPGGDCSALKTKVDCDGYTQCQWVPDLMWAGHDVSGDLAGLPLTGGFNEETDKLYECIFTVTSGDYGDVEVTVEVTDETPLTGVSPPDNVFLNPAVSLDFSVTPDDTVTFPPGDCLDPLQYSPDTLKIKNSAEGGVDLVVWLAGTDLEAADGAAKCPTSNIIDVDKYLEFRCKIGTEMCNEWRDVPNPNDKEDCGPAGSSGTDDCQGAVSITYDCGLRGPDGLLMNWHTAECWFRFEYPCPCVGDFEEGGHIIIYARAI